MGTPHEEDQGGSRRRGGNTSEREKQRSTCKDDKLKMTVLYFSCSVLITHEKDDTQIADGPVQIVDDLDRCRTFPWRRRSYHYLIIHVQKLNLAKKSANAFEKKKTTWACPGFILPLKLLPFECIPALTPKFATVHKDVIEPVPRICQWKTNFKKKKAPTLEDAVQRVGDTKGAGHWVDAKLCS
ncbi:hypothetical protein TIFTF001_017607 [Ficus carica]|uniref:Uncharacterized protein n=1 Tax=Ficus carica TaxID=3494 RepID=A0AA88ALG2_FICCA|nr:hypothetical protein TIFTF001_017607 [Ficus carica]